jgi:hypothetical protein
MDLETKRANMEEKPIAQGTGDHVIAVYPDRVALMDGGQNRSTLSVGLKEVSAVSVKGLINCTLTIEINNGRSLNVEGMAFPDVRCVKAAIERQKKTAAFVSNPDSSSET